MNIEVLFESEKFDPLDIRLGNNAFQCHENGGKMLRGNREKREKITRTISFTPHNNLNNLTCGIYNY